MKKKNFFGILFSALLAINVISVSKTDVNDLSLTSLMQTAQAQVEITIPGCEWRCHTNENQCLPGNWISFRACCYIPYNNCN